MAKDGCWWKKAEWNGSDVTIREYNAKSKGMTSQLMLKEMENLSFLRHPNITLLMGTCCGPAKNTLFLVLEPLMVPSLHHFLHGTVDYQFSPMELHSIACGITSGKCIAQLFFFFELQPTLCMQLYAISIMW